ncbi:MAG: nucleotide exchange factor GrpE, partial [Oscillospiraceae bacterium]|nr:nucleotide exchange factor GrpE [Candidatus Equicaccousia limihippi]
MSETKKPKTAAKEPAKTAKTSKETEKLNAQITALTQELEKQKDLVLRTAAEFDNYKRRTLSEKDRIAEFAKSDLLKELLPVIDNAVRATSAQSGTEEYNKGIEIIAKQLLSLTDKFGMEELAAVGDNFDPNIHEAVMETESEELQQGQISTVLQQGYKI